MHAGSWTVSFICRGGAGVQLVGTAPLCVVSRPRRVPSHPTLEGVLVAGPPLSWHPYITVSCVVGARVSCGRNLWSLEGLCMAPLCRRWAAVNPAGCEVGAQGSECFSHLHIRMTQDCVLQRPSLPAAASVPWLDSEHPCPVLGHGQLHSRPLRQRHRIPSLFLWVVRLPWDVGVSGVSVYVAASACGSHGPF